MKNKCSKWALLALCFGLSAHAGTPLWTFEALTETNISVTKEGSAQVSYTIRNQSSKPKTLVMRPVAGISQSTPCQLGPKGSCTLTLNINGSGLQGDVIGGPMMCLQGSDLQCYQPGPNALLRARLSQQPPVQQFSVTPSAGANGSISPDTVQVVNAGSSLTFTAVPDVGFGVNEWLVDGNVVQTGGATYQLGNILASSTVEVTFGQTTLSPLTQNLALSINSPGANPALSGNPRIIRIENTGSIPASNVQVNTSGLPNGTSITSNNCTGTLNAGATCDITITPGGTASPDISDNACTTSPGTEPEPTLVTVSADNAPSTNVNVLVLGYGCIYQGGLLFSVDDSTTDTGSIGGKVAALTDEEENPGDFLFQWATVSDDTGADSLTNGLDNTNALASPAGQYPAAQACLNKNDQGFTDWYLPAICELGRYVDLGTDAGCGTTSPNVYTTLYLNNLGVFDDVPNYWSSSEYSDEPEFRAWFQEFSSGPQDYTLKTILRNVRCIRAFTP